jgi:hypothetical protein
VFSLTLCAVSALFFYICENARSIQSTPLDRLSGRVAVMLMNASMDVPEELYILATFGTLLILPQILSYLISDIFGWVAARSGFSNFTNCHQIRSQFSGVERHVRRYLL